MVTLTHPRTPRAPGDDDLSDRVHRQLIGYIGLFLPWILIVIAALRPTPDLPSWVLLGSVSAYYYTGAVAAFVGLLVALALFLFTYRGYQNEHNWADRAAGITSGFAALGVAFFPTDAPANVTAAAWWTPANGHLHYICAVILFSTFAVFALWLFRLGEKRLHNHVYLACGIAILGSMIWAAFNGRNGKPIFLPESIALVAFASSWLLKGEAHQTIVDGVRAFYGRGRD